MDMLAFTLELYLTHLKKNMRKLKLYVQSWFLLRWQSEWIFLMNYCIKSAKSNILHEIDAELML